MSEILTNKRRHVQSTVTLGAVIVALGAGYALRGSHVQAQQGSGSTPVTSAPVVQTPATRDMAAMQNAFEDVAKAVSPAVVTITTESRQATPSSLRRGPRTQPFGNPFGGNPFGGNRGGNGGGQDPFQQFFRDFGFQPNSLQRQQMKAHLFPAQGGGLGSGMIYRSEGLILTNAHVVRGADTVTFKLADDREFRNAKVLGIDERTDVAVVKINADNLPTVKLGDSSKIEVGDWAIAVGNPYGLSHTVTVGVISAKAREIPLNDRNPGDYLQTDASINPGNSGGPLVDIYGRVVGINNAIFSESGGNVGIGFAVPINTARNIADQLVKTGKIHRGYLGIKITTLQADDAPGLELDPNTKGVLVHSVEDANGPGARAGLQAGDIIQSFNGQTVTRDTELQRLVGDAPVNSTVTLKVMRNGQTVTLTTKLDELKDEATRVAQANGKGGNDNNPDNGAVAAPSLGLRLRSLTPQLAQRFGLKDTQGVVVTEVDDNSPAAAAGISQGDIIERVGTTKVSTPQEVAAAVKRILGNTAGPNAGDEKRVALYVNHQGQHAFVFVRIGK